MPGNRVLDYSEHGWLERRRILERLLFPSDGLPQRIGKAIQILLTGGPQELYRKMRQRRSALHTAMNAVAGVTTLPRTPNVTIVIPVYNGLSYTQQCIRSLYDSDVRTTFEVIVVDNGSSDGTPRWFRRARERYPSLHYVRNPSNIGFAQAVNKAARMARGKYLTIANNDIIVTRGWLDSLVATGESRPEIAIVSPVTNYVGEGPQVDPESTSLEPSGALAYGETLRKANKPPFEVLDRLVFFCVLVKRHVFEFLGGLSDIFGLANFEDDDFCLRARLAGFSLVVDPSVFVFHYGSRTFTEQRINHAELMRRNYQNFFNRVADFSVQPLLLRAKRNVRPIVSVVLRTVNRPHLLRDALTSLANQTFQPFEVVVVNDAGEDVSPILAEFAGRLAVQHVQHSQPCGRAAALNSGARAASGDWITYLDDDDIAYPTHLEVLVDALQRAPQVRVAYTDANRAFNIPPDGEERIVFREPHQSFEFSKIGLLIQNRIPILTLAHAASCFREVGFFDETLQELEDWDFIIRLSRVAPFRHVRQITCEYRSRVSRDIATALLARRHSTLEAMRQIHIRYPVEDPALQARRSAVIEALERELEDLTRIAAMPCSDEEKALLSTVRVYATSPSDVLAAIIKQPTGRRAMR